MNILVASDIYFFEEPGGSSRMAWEVAKGLMALGHRVQMVAGSSRSEPADEKRDGCRVARYPRKLSSPWASFQAARQAVRRLSFPLDAVILLHPFTGLAVLSEDWVKGATVIYCFNSPWAREYQIREAFHGRRRFWRPWLMKRVERRVLKKAHGIVTLSHYMTQELVKEHATPKEKIFCMNGGADVDRFRPSMTAPEARRRLGWPLDKTILLSVRNLEARMGLENLLEAFSHLAAEDHSLELRLVGAGSIQGYLEKQVQQLGLNGRALFLGEVPDDQLPLCYQASDLFVLPTRALEGFGLVTAEALASGLPVVATPVGATPEVLSALDRSLLSDDASPAALQRVIKKFLGRRAEWPFLRRACSTYAREHYSWAGVAKSLQSLMGNLRVNP